MSKRQQNRIAQALRLNEACEASSDDSEMESVKKSDFQFLGDGFPESSSDEEEEEQLMLTKEPENTAIIESDVDAAFLEEFIVNPQVVSAVRRNSTLEKHLSIDLSSLDFDVATHRQLKALEMQLGRKGIGAEPRSTSHRRRKFLFGSKQDDWVKMPSFICGGLAMNKVGESQFTIRSSDEYLKLDRMYDIVRNTGDMNQLVMFLAHYPYHVEGLLQLSSMFRRVGQMDKATDILRRCLYCMECTFSESFKNGLGGNQIAYFSDSSSYECSLLFTTLFRYFRLLSTSGLLDSAAEMGRLITSLNPYDNACLILLHLDHALVAAQRYELILLYSGVVDLSGADFDAGASSIMRDPLLLEYHRRQRNDSSSSSGVVGRYVQLLQDFRWTTPHKITCPPSSSEDDASSTCSVADLPNWWFSLAVSTFLAEEQAEVRAKYRRSDDQDTCAERKEEREESAADFLRYRTPSEDNEQQARGLPTPHILSLFYLKAALLRWPFMLPALLEKLNLLVSATWKQVLLHSLFKGAANRIPKGCFLHKMPELYATGNASLWNRPEVMAWLETAATQLTAGLSSVWDGKADERDSFLADQAAEYQRLSQSPMLHQYRKAQLEDFLEEEPRFPNQMQVLEPQLQDIAHILSGRVRFDAFHKQLQEVTKERHSRGRRKFEDEFYGSASSLWLDLSLPLLQLFWMSMLPWYRVR